MNQNRREFLGRALLKQLWLLPTILICLVWSTYNAWSLTIAAAAKHRDTL